MLEIRKYQANDGTEFNTAEKAIAHERLIDELNAIMARLPKRPADEGCRFSNGYGYVQHDLTKLHSVKSDILRIAMRYCTSPPWFQQSIDDPTAHASWAGRLIDDACPRPIWTIAWHRISCIDKHGREWGQPYFADHPDKAEGQFRIMP